MTTVVLATFWVAQTMGWQPPASHLWQSAVSNGIAAPLTITFLATCSVFAFVWSKVESFLFRKALKL
jgi:hypothetical protein